MMTEGLRAVEELRALRRVATLVAEGALPLQLFAVVAEEAARVLDVPIATVLRYESDGTATSCARSEKGPPLAIGTRFALDGPSVLRRIRTTGKAARIDDYSMLNGELPDAVRVGGIRSSVGTPIVVSGRLWGAMVASNSHAEPLPEGTEERLADFTELLATAIANAQSREAVRVLADEQAALRRVATLVAQEALPQDLFEAVAEEVGRLLSVGTATMGRFETDDSVTIIAAWSATKVAFPIGVRWRIEGTNIAWRVLQTGRAARLDDFSVATDPIGVAAREAGYKSAVGGPIVVKGHIWGLVTATSSEGPLPTDTEARLASFTELVATAIANAESRSELAASRHRIVTASDETRRRIERNLHDGTQQRLVALALAVRAVEADAPADLTDLRFELSQIAAGLVDAAAELQEISRGIHPATLSEGGLTSAVRTLARRSPIPVDLEITIEGRLPDSIEVATYYVTSEALANAAKHSQASRLEVSLTARDKAVFVTIRDDGIGGADPVRGSGLVGLVDRVEAIGGTIDIRSPRGDGTHITTILPRD
jgi:signal transduction histidine kinase